MKTIKYLAGFLLIGLPLVSHSQEEQKKEAPAQKKEVFDPELAKELGADEYGMKRYVMAFLKRGPNQSQSKEEAERLQRAHMDNIGKMAEQGKLVIAGPFLDNGDIRGIYIFNVETIEEAEALTKTDPAIQAGRLVMELHPWYGSAALMKTVQIHQTITKKEI